MKISNIVLIGMPSSGKSTIGKLLAGNMGFLFIDTDAVIIEKGNRPLKDIVNTDGLDAFLEIQEKAVLELRLEGYVIATGGSVVYSKAAMEHLAENGLVVYLKEDFEEIEKRLAPGRRFARGSGQSLVDMYNERVPLYEKYSHETIGCSGKSVEEIAEEIGAVFQNKRLNLGSDRL